MADIFGTSANEVIDGTALDDTIFSGPSSDPDATATGGDTIRAGGGNDSVFGQDGNDALYGGATTAFGETGTGDDILHGGDGTDALFGQDGADQLFGDAGTDSLRGGAGNDTLDGGIGADQIYGGSNSSNETGTGDDVLIGGLGADELYGGDGNDTLNGGDDNDFLYGHDGTNLLSGDAGVDVLTSMGVNDLVDGGTGGETTGAGDLAVLDRSLFAGVLSLSLDSVTGGVRENLGDGTLVTNIERLDFTGGSGADVIEGLTAGTYADMLRGGAEADTLRGGGGSDELYGGSGTDTLEGGTGNDVLYGGSTTSSTEAGTGDDILRGGDGLDGLFGQDGADQLFGDAGADQLRGGAGNDTLDGGDGGDQLSGGNAFGNDTGTGDDILNGRLGADLLYGGDGNDMLNGGDDNDQLFGHDGNDSLDGGNGNDALDAGAGDDTIISSAGIDTLIGGTNTGVGDFALVDRSTSLAANLTLNINTGSTNIGDGTVSAGTSVQGIERIEIRGGSGNDSFVGGALNDTLVGNGGNDTLVGNGGNDILDGGAGTNLLTGGAGDDTLNGAVGSTTTIVYDSVRDDFRVTQLPAGRFEIFDLRSGSPSGTDGAGGISFIQFTDGTFAPALIPPSGTDATVTASEDAARAFTLADFGFTDSNAGDTLSAVRIDTLPAAGTLTLSGSQVASGQIVAVTNITAGDLVFTPAADANGNSYAGFAFSVADQTSTFDLTPNTMTVDVAAVNDAPVITSSGGGAAAALGVLENTSAVATVTATDIEAPAQTLAFSIVGGGDRALFDINGSSGALSFISSPDFESPADENHNNVYEVTVQASDGTLVDTQAISVAVTDVDEFDVSLPTDGDVATDRVAENAVNGSVVGVTAFAFDSDGTSNGVTYSLADTAGGRFAIDASTGVVTVAAGSLLDREAANSHTITVQAVSEDGSSSQSFFAIALSDVDEFDVGAVTDANGAANQVLENAADGTLVGLTASASDADATTNAITYSLTDSAGGRFAVDAATGMVSVATRGLLDRELAPSHSIVIRAASQDGSFNDRAFTIALTDVDEVDVGAVTDANAAPDQVAENAATGTVVGLTAFASDADATTNAITYSLTDNAGGRFAIDAAGAVSVANGSLLDFETATSHNITVLASSADGSSSNKVFAIGITDVIEGGGNQPPVITGGDTATYSRAENTTSVASITALDPEGQTLTYSLSGGADLTKFVINAATGTLQFATAPDFENPTDAGANNVYDVVVGVSDGNGGSDTQALAVTVTNVLGLTLAGTNMSNTLTGGAEEDTISGVRGNDKLNGGAGNDTISGGDGNDDITGGLGMDRLTGDAGGDNFIFNSAAESQIGARADVILDFTRRDHIDLHVIDASMSAPNDQAFAFVGTAAFTNVAGQLRYSSTDPTQAVTHIYGDVNGDGQADFEIVLAGRLTLAASDFVL